MDTSIFLATNIKDFTRNEMIRDIRQRRNEIINIHKYTMISFIYLVGNAKKGTIAEQTNHATIMMIILPWAVGIKEPKPYTFIAIAFFKIHDLNFVNPFRYRIIVLLYDRLINRNIF